MNTGLVSTKLDKKFLAMFMGFIDGDGYFDIGEQKQYNKKTKAPARSTIRIRLASNVNIRDLALLEYFVETLKVVPSPPPDTPPPYLSFPLSEYLFSPFLCRGKGKRSTEERGKEVSGNGGGGDQRGPIGDPPPAGGKNRYHVWG